MFWSEHWSIDSNNNAWVFSAQYNALCHINMENNVVRYIGRLPVSFDGERQFSYSICSGDNVFFLPDQSTQIAIYHKDNGRFSTIDLSGMMASGRLRCTDAKLIDNKLWVYSSGCRLFMCIDPRNEKIEKICSVGGDTLLWDYEIVWNDKNAYFTSRNASRIFRFNTETQKIYTYDFEQINEKFRTIQICDDKLYISGESGNLYCIDKEKMEYCECINVNINRSNGYPYLYSCFLNGKLWLIPYESDKMLYMDMKSRKIECLMDFSNGKQQKDACYGLNYIRDDRFIGISKFYSGQILEIDTEKKMVQNRRYFFELEERRSMLKDINRISGGFYHEDEFYDVSNFLNSL